MRVTSFDYKSEDGALRSTGIENSTSGFGGWSNPDWLVPGFPNNDWLHYLGGDGGSWQSKVHADGGFPGGGLPKAYFENRHPGQSSHNSDFIEVVDHQGIVKTVRLVVIGNGKDFNTAVIEFEINNK